MKRHRDEWAIRTKNEGYRPISAVITTLATHAYLDVVAQSVYTAFTPLQAILAIVNRMPDHIHRYGNEYYVCNPEDNGENFAENGIVRMKVINTLMPLINGMRVPVRR